jgi:hypothetical protein
MSAKEINLGDVVSDVITGFRGTVVGLYFPLTGCRRVEVQPKLDYEGKAQDAGWFDIDRLVKADPPEQPAAALLN